MNSRIGIDIDDTLTSFQETARNIFGDMALERGDKRLQRGAYSEWGEWRSPVDVTDGDTWLEVIERCHSSENIVEQIPFPGAADVLWELEQQGYELMYISQRAESTSVATEHWLNEHGFPPATLLCVSEDKSKFLTHFQYLIDDRPKTLVEFVYDFHWKHKYGSENGEMGRKAFGLYMPYNAALTDVPGIKLAPNWRLLRQYLIEQNVLKETCGNLN